MVAARPTDRGRRFVLAVTGLAGLFMTAAGMAALLAPGGSPTPPASPTPTSSTTPAPSSSASGSPCCWRWPGATRSPWRWPGSWLPTPPMPSTTPSTWTWAAAAAIPGGWPPAVLAAALVVRLGQLGWVVGEVTPAASPVLVRFVRQKTVLVTTYRRDGRPVSTPVSLAVDGDHAYLRSFEQAGKTRRIRHNPRVDIAPSTARGRPTGPGIQATARRLEGAESRRAAPCWPASTHCCTACWCR